MKFWNPWPNYGGLGAATGGNRGSEDPVFGDFSSFSIKTPHFEA